MYSTWGQFLIFVSIMVSYISSKLSAAPATAPALTKQTVLDSIWRDNQQNDYYAIADGAVVKIWSGSLQTGYKVFFLSQTVFLTRYTRCVSHVIFHGQGSHSAAWKNTRWGGIILQVSGYTVACVNQVKKTLGRVWLAQCHTTYSWLFFILLSRSCSLYIYISFTSTSLFVQEFVPWRTVTLKTDSPVPADMGATTIVV